MAIDFTDPSISHDLVLVVQGKRFYVDSKVIYISEILTTYSPDLSRLFNSNSHENYKKEMELEDMKSDDFDMFLRSVYSSAVATEKEKVSNDRVKNFFSSYGFGYYLKDNKPFVQDSNGREIPVLYAKVTNEDILQLAEDGIIDLSKFGSKEVQTIDVRVLEKANEKRKRINEEIYHKNEIEKKRRLSTSNQAKISNFFQFTRVEIEVNDDVMLNNEFFRNMKLAANYTKEWNQVFPADTVVIYTDGSRNRYNPLDRSSGVGVGIYHGPHHTLNRAYNLTRCKHDSGFAEIAAAILALNDLKEWKFYKKEMVIIRTDYLDMIRALNNPAVREGSSFPALYNLLRQTCQQFPQGVKFEHVYAHDNHDPDFGNNAADEFAHQAATFGSITTNVKFDMAKDRTREPGRARSRRNSPGHIRTHSAFVAPCHIVPSFK